MISVIMSGGNGTRLWPLSRKEFPKQFLSLFGESMFLKTVARLDERGPIWIVGSEDQKVLTEKLMFNQDESNRCIFEPQGRNTAPVIALVTHLACIEGKENDVFGTFPSDHLIEDLGEFNARLNVAEKVAKEGKLVVMGVKPTYPATGYGYVSFDSIPDDRDVFPVMDFIEKPNLGKAKELYSEKKHYWNSGIFVFRPIDIAKSFEKYQPEMWSTIKLIKKDLSNLEEVYLSLQPISFEYSIAEKLEPSELYCVPIDVGWNDVGSWEAVADIGLPDSPLKVEVESSGNFVVGDKNKAYSFIGTKDLVVVDSKDAVLIAHKKESQKVKEVVSYLEIHKRELIENHPVEEKDWGTLEVMKNYKNMKSKICSVEPGREMSMKDSGHFTKHWIFVSGEGNLLLNDKEVHCKKGVHISISPHARFLLKNEFQESLFFVEVVIELRFLENEVTV